MMPNPSLQGFPGQPPRAPASTGWQAAPAPKPALPTAFPVNAALAANPSRAPTFRAQAPDAPARAPAPLMLPTPEALGLAAVSVSPPAPAFDWNDARARLRRLGAVGFHLDACADGRWRATLLMPGGAQPTRHIEASAASDAAAVAGALLQAEALASSR